MKHKKGTPTQKRHVHRSQAGAWEREEGRTTTKLAPPLQAFAAAALALPGLLAPTLSYAADEDEVDFQYSHYQEGKRSIYVDTSHVNDQFLSPPGTIVKAPNVLNPIEADSLHGSARVSLTDRVKFGFNYTQDTWAGATPIATAPVVTTGMMGLHNNKGVLVGASPWLANADGSGASFLDLKGNFYDHFLTLDPSTGAYLPGAKDNQLTHTLASASPETRQQGDFKLSYDWDRASINLGGGVSTENDYESRFGNLGTRLDFNQKRTSVNLGLSYTDSDTHATLDPITFNFINAGPYAGPAFSQPIRMGNKVVYEDYSDLTGGTLDVNKSIIKGKEQFDSATLKGNRQDWTSQLGLSQVLSKNAQLQMGLGYTHSAGFLSNPYKAVYVFNIFPTSTDPNHPWAMTGAGQLEARPHERNQVTGNLGYQYYLEPLDAALHAHYTVAHDDWGINAHTFDADWVQPVGGGWTVIPRVRYYSQSAADFYTPYLTTVQLTDQDGNNLASPLNKVMPKYYSSDQRLSGFGAVSGGVTVAKQFAKGLSLEAGFEYYTHQGGLKLGGGGEQAFADYDFWSTNAALKLNLGALRIGGDDGGSHAHQHQADLTPAGLMFTHGLNQAGDMMLGYRYMRNEQAGAMLSGRSEAGPATVAAQGCGTQHCMMATSHMAMNMHMLELMVGLGDRLTLMLMPQWTDMAMNMTDLVMPKHDSHNGSIGGMAIHTHQSGGVGDTGLYTLFKLFEQPGHSLVLSLGGTAPSGDVAVMRRNNAMSTPNIPMDYGMQLGSGTWDLKPSLSYSGTLEAWAWGAQATGTKRLQDHNESGYALGDIFQGSAWGGYRWSDWLSTTLRGVYSWQDSIYGGFKPIASPDLAGAGSVVMRTYTQSVPAGPSDFSANYGGQYVDLGLGVNVTIPSGAFAGHSLKFEWLQPVYTKVNGYQLDRDYGLTATWGVGF